MPALAVDRMGAIKTQMEALDAEYARLRLKVLDGTTPATGKQWCAVVQDMEHRRILVRDAESLLPPDVFSELVKTTRQTNVTLKRRATLH